jgi:CRISPR system Cascade subunit CasE
MNECAIFLSRLTLNSRLPEVQRDLRDPYQMHRTLSRAWGEGPEYEQARVLFRVEEGSGAYAVVLVQSKVAPDWSRLPLKNFGSAPQTKEWQPSVKSDQNLAFRLRGNPTVKRDGKRWGLYREQEQHEWIERKAQQHGFALLNVTIRTEGQPQRALGRAGSEVQFWRETVAACSQRDKGNVLTERTAPAVFCAARFDGILQVTDPQTFQYALENGIGPSKGLGFGLLSIART